MKYIVSMACITLMVTFMTGCTTAPVRMGAQPEKDFEIVGKSRGSGASCLLVGFIPIGQNSRYQRAYEDAVRSGGGDDLINPEIKERWFWVGPATFFTTKVAGDVIKYGTGVGTTIVNTNAVASPRTSNVVRPVPRNVRVAGADDSIQMFFAKRPEAAFKEVGRVSVQRFRNFPPGIAKQRASIDSELRKQAARLNANAIIDITEDFASVSGVAVILQDVRGGDAVNKESRTVEDVPGRLQQIKTLKDNGVLTEEEYQAKRKMLVEKL